MPTSLASTDSLNGRIKKALLKLTHLPSDAMDEYTKSVCLVEKFGVDRFKGRMTSNKRDFDELECNEDGVQFSRQDGRRSTFSWEEVKATFPNDSSVTINFDTPKTSSITFFTDRYIINSQL